MLNRIQKKFKKSFLIGFSLIIGVGFSVLASTWQGVEWIAEGEVILSEKMKDNFDNLFIAKADIPMQCTGGSNLLQWDDGWKCFGGSNTLPQNSLTWKDTSVIQAKSIIDFTDIKNWFEYLFSSKLDKPTSCHGDNKYLTWNSSGWKCNIWQGSKSDVNYTSSYAYSKDWLLDGEIISAEKMKGNFQYLSDIKVEKPSIKCVGDRHFLQWKDGWKCYVKPLPPVNGKCGSSKNSCIKGNLKDINDSSSQYKWECLGLYGGAKVNCSKSKVINRPVKSCSYDNRGKTVTVYAKVVNNIPYFRFHQTVGTGCCSTAISPPYIKEGDTVGWAWESIGSFKDKTRKAERPVGWKNAWVPGKEWGSSYTSKKYGVTATYTFVNDKMNKVQAVNQVESYWGGYVGKVLCSINW